MTELREIASLIRDLGFPVFMCAWLVFRLSPVLARIDANTSTLAKRTIPLLFFLLSIAGCAAMQAGRRDADAGTPFVHAPYGSVAPTDWGGYLISLLIGAASGGAGAHALRKRKGPDA